MASARTEHYDISLRRGHSLKQSGPTGTAPTPSPEKPSEGKVWAQAHQQVKPIWRLEKKHVGTLSAGLGAPPQPAYLFCPSTLGSSGTSAVTASHGNCCYLHSLPDLFSSLPISCPHLPLIFKVDKNWSAGPLAVSWVSSELPLYYSLEYSIE